jgi:HPt (histidine-containing phosphotransfer) domain-containing protein
MQNENLSENPILSRMQEVKRETDSEFVLELIDIYIKETPEQIQKIAAALRSKDMPALVTVAHKLKGSSLNIGAVQLAAVCLKLEESGRTGKMIPSDTAEEEIKAGFEEVKTVLLEYKRNQSNADGV